MLCWSSFRAWSEICQENDRLFQSSPIRRWSSSAVWSVRCKSFSFCSSIQVPWLSSLAKVNKIYKVTIWSSCQLFRQSRTDILLFIENLFSLQIYQTTNGQWFCYWTWIFQLHSPNNKQQKQTMDFVYHVLLDARYLLVAASDHVQLHPHLSPSSTSSTTPNASPDTSAPDADYTVSDLEIKYSSLEVQ